MLQKRFLFLSIIYFFIAEHRGPSFYLYFRLVLCFIFVLDFDFNLKLALVFLLIKWSLYIVILCIQTLLSLLLFSLFLKFVCYNLTHTQCHLTIPFILYSWDLILLNWYGLWMFLSVNNILFLWVMIFNFIFAFVW